ncbi:MAG: flagellar motor protein MotB [Candidatus Brocadiales bacterium]|nr:flagellar motor protein MotB [Candidatus Bathyanammoxibius amoris]
MNRTSLYLKLFLATVFTGMALGCAETEELRGLNRRQAITIRDQADEIDLLKGDLAGSKERISRESEEKSRLMAELNNLAKAIGGGATVRQTPEGPVIQLPEIILFDSGLADIKPGGEDALKKLAEHLKSRPNENLRIAGNTDSDPIVKTKYMWKSNHHLAAGRALSVFQYLTEQQGVDPGRVYVIGYGPNRPISNDNTNEGKKKNRRVEFMLTEAEGS